MVVVTHCMHWLSKAKLWWKCLHSLINQNIISLKLKLKIYLISPSTYLILFCLFCSFQEELDEIKAVWNNHCIQPTKNYSVPRSIPDVLYAVPQLWGSEDFVVPRSNLDACKQACKFRQPSLAMKMYLTSFTTNTQQAQEFYVMTGEALRPLIFKWLSQAIYIHDNWFHYLCPVV